MGQRRLLVILLIVATVLVDLTIAIGGFGGFMDGRWWLADKRQWAYLLLGLAISHVNLLAAFSGWNGIPLPWGLASVVMTSVYSTVLLYETDTSPRLGHTMTRIVVLLLANAAVTLGLALLTRAVNLRIAVTKPGGSSTDWEEGSRLQFTLGRMFAWTTSTAVILGILRYTMDYEIVRSINREIWAELFAICAIHSSSALIAVGAMLEMNSWTTRIALFIVMPRVVFYLDQSATEQDLAHLWLIVLPQFVWLLAATLVLRVAGYRLVRRRSPVESAPPAADT